MNLLSSPTADDISGLVATEAYEIIKLPPDALL